MLCFVGKQSLRFRFVQQNPCSLSLHDEKFKQALTEPGLPKRCGNMRSNPRWLHVPGFCLQMLEGLAWKEWLLKKTVLPCLIEWLAVGADRAWAKPFLARCIKICALHTTPYKATPALLRVRHSTKRSKGMCPKQAHAVRIRCVSKTAGELRCLLPELRVRLRILLIDFVESCDSAEPIMKIWTRSKFFLLCNGMTKPRLSGRRQAVHCIELFQTTEAQ